MKSVKYFWRASFVTQFCLAYLILLLCIVAYSLLEGFISPVAPEGPDSGLMASNENIIRAGDFPVFYAAGSVALSERGLLYDLDTQSSLQQNFWKSDDGGFHVFAYPPWVAIALIPFAVLPPLVAKLIFIMVSLLLSYLSVFRLREYCVLQLTNTFALAFLLVIPPYVSGVLGGQNSAFSLFLFLSALSAHKNKRYYLVGVLIALWNFKPQYSIPALLLLLTLDNSVLVIDRLKVLTSYVLLSITEVLISILYFGGDIFEKWLVMMKTLANLNQDSSANVARMISLPSLGQYLLGNYGTWSLVFLIFLVAYFVLLPAFAASRVDILRGPLIGLLVVLFSPQTGHYDIALALPFFLLVLKEREFSSLVWKILGTCFLILLTMTIQFQTSVPLLTILLALSSAVGMRNALNLYPPRTPS